MREEYKEIDQPIAPKRSYVRLVVLSVFLVSAFIALPYYTIQQLLHSTAKQARGVITSIDLVPTSRRGSLKYQALVHTPDGNFSDWANPAWKVGDTVIVFYRLSPNGGRFVDGIEEISPAK